MKSSAVFFAITVLVMLASAFPAGQGPQASSGAVQPTFVKAGVFDGFVKRLHAIQAAIEKLLAPEPEEIPQGGSPTPAPTPNPGIGGNPPAGGGPGIGGPGTGPTGPGNGQGTGPFGPGNGPSGGPSAGPSTGPQNPPANPSTPGSGQPSANPPASPGLPTKPMPPYPEPQPGTPVVNPGKGLFPGEPSTEPSTPVDGGQTSIPSVPSAGGQPGSPASSTSEAVASAIEKSLPSGETLVGIESSVPASEDGTYVWSTIIVKRSVMVKIANGLGQVVG